MDVEGAHHVIRNYHRKRGIAAVKAAVLAKFLLLGNAMKIGTRYNTEPLIWPTLHTALVFVTLLIVLTIIEEASWVSCTDNQLPSR